MRRSLMTLVAVATLLAPAAAMPGETLAQRSVQQDGLVNVFAADLIDVENVNVAAVVGVLANVCPALDANVVALAAAAVDDSGDAQTVTCTATQDATISQNNPGRGR